MPKQEIMEIRGFYRSHSHLPIWEVMEKAGIWQQNGLKVSFEFCDSSEAAEKALFGGEVDFVSGNHISPYLLVKRGKPIVCLTSPSNDTSSMSVSLPLPTSGASNNTVRPSGDAERGHTKPCPP